MFMKMLVALIFLVISPIVHAQVVQEINPKWTLGVNMTQTAAFVASKYIIKWHVTFIPIHIDGSYVFNNKWGLGFGLVYRYENYHFKNPINTPALHKLWTNYHELFLLAGPRYSFFGEGNRGLYASLKAGPGAAFSKGGYAVTIVAQPEIGYSFVFGNAVAFHLDLAAGILLNIPIVENPKLGFKLSPIGWLVHRTVPIMRVGLGIAF
jgi:hypothetical protein